MWGGGVERERERDWSYYSCSNQLAWQFVWTEFCREDVIGGIFIEPQHDRAGVWAIFFLS